MGSEATVGAGGADGGVASLREELAFVKAKNRVLLDQIQENEQALAGSDEKAFGDVIPNEDRAFWRGQFLENREAAVGRLNRLRQLLANRGGTPAAALPRPLRNRADVRPAAAGGGRPSENEQVCRAARMRFRASEIANRDGLPFTMAFSLAEREMGGSR